METVFLLCADPVADKGSGPRPFLEYHKAIGFLSKISPETLENKKATKPAFNVGPSSA